MMKNQIVYIDMDDVLCDYKGSYNEHIQRCPEMKFPQSQIDFFRNLKPIKGALEAFQKLSSLSNIDVYILSAPSEYNPISYMEKRLWVEKCLGFESVSKLILSSNKSLLKGDYLIDDYSEGKGQENFEGQLIQFGTSEYPDWNSVLKLFLV